MVNWRPNLLILTFEILPCWANSVLDQQMHLDSRFLSATRHSMVWLTRSDWVTQLACSNMQRVTQLRRLCHHSHHAASNSIAVVLPNMNPNMNRSYADYMDRSWMDASSEIIVERTRKAVYIELNLEINCKRSSLLNSREQENKLNADSKGRCSINHTCVNNVCLLLQISRDLRRVAFQSFAFGFGRNVHWIIIQWWSSMLSGSTVDSHQLGSSLFELIANGHRQCQQDQTTALPAWQSGHQWTT